MSHNTSVQQIIIHALTSSASYEQNSCLSEHGNMDICMGWLLSLSFQPHFDNEPLQTKLKEYSWYNTDDKGHDEKSSQI